MLSKNYEEMLNPNGFNSKDVDLFYRVFFNKSLIEMDDDFVLLLKIKPEELAVSGKDFKWTKKENIAAIELLTDYLFVYTMPKDIVAAAIGAIIEFVFKLGLSKERALKRLGSLVRLTTAQVLHYINNPNPGINIELGYIIIQHIIDEYSYEIKKFDKFSKELDIPTNVLLSDVSSYNNIHGCLVKQDRVSGLFKLQANFEEEYYCCSIETKGKYLFNLLWSLEHSTDAVIERPAVYDASPNRLSNASINLNYFKDQESIDLLDNNKYGVIIPLFERWKGPIIGSYYLYAEKSGDTPLKKIERNLDWYKV